jgi:hypothetical protein
LSNFLFLFFSPLIFPIFLSKFHQNQQPNNIEKKLALFIHILFHYSLVVSLTQKIFSVNWSLTKTDQMELFYLDFVRYCKTSL